MVGAALALAMVACKTSTPEVAPLASDAGLLEGGSDATVDAGICCPPDPRPSCCMNYGGFRCEDVCDSMPVPSDPGWSLGTDERGCAVWKNPNDFLLDHGTFNPSTSYCGVPPRNDGGTDADAPDAADATTD